MDMDDTNRQKHMKKELTNLTTELSNSNKKISEDVWLSSSSLADLY